MFKKDSQCRRLMTIQVFPFSRLKKQTPKSSLCKSTVVQPGYGFQTKRKMRTRLDIAGCTMYCGFKISLKIRHCSIFGRIKDYFLRIS